MLLKEVVDIVPAQQCLLQEVDKVLILRLLFLTFFMFVLVRRLRLLGFVFLYVGVRESPETQIANSVQHPGCDGRVRTLHQAILVSLFIGLQDAEEQQFFERSVLYARLKTHLHPDFHHKEIEEYLLHHHLRGYVLLDDILLPQRGN